MVSCTRPKVVRLRPRGRPAAVAADRHHVVIVARPPTGSRGSPDGHRGAGRRGRTPPPRGGPAPAPPRAPGAARGGRGGAGGRGGGAPPGPPPPRPADRPGTFLDDAAGWTVHRYKACSPLLARAASHA